MSEFHTTSAFYGIASATETLSIGGEKALQALHYTQGDMQTEYNIESIELTPQQQKAFERVGQQAVARVTNRYGSGYPHFKVPGENPLRYHGGYHTIGVEEDAERVGIALGLSRSERTVNQVAARYHDETQGLGGGNNEQASAERVAFELNNIGAPKGAIIIAQFAIHATDIERGPDYQPVFDSNGNVIQKAMTLDYPSKLAELSAKILASADFGKLHVPEGPRLAGELYREITGHNIITPPIDENYIEFLRNQVKITKGYQYPLPEAEKILATHREEVITYNAYKLDLVESGEIVTWEQSVALDDAFALDPHDFLRARNL